MFATLFVSLGLFASSLNPKPIIVPPEISQSLKSFEPSAVIFLADLNSYLIASDDTTEHDEPFLFLMNESGAVEDSMLPITGIKKMTDIESISEGNDGYLYLLSSQGLNKNGKDKKERNMFVRAVRREKTITAIDSIFLRPLLLMAFDVTTDETLKKLNMSVQKKLDIESHFIRDGELFVGLKEPQIEQGKAIILSLGNVERIFASEQIELKLWETIDFASITGEADLISDILVVENNLLLSTTQAQGPGRIWNYNQSTKALDVIEEFETFRPEGMAKDSNSDRYMTVFDQGVDQAYFLLKAL